MGDQSEPALEKKKRAEILENAQHLSSDGGRFQVYRKGCSLMNSLASRGFLCGFFLKCRPYSQSNDTFKNNNKKRY